LRTASLILALGAVSGAQLNPLVTLCDALDGHRPWRDVAAYVAAQTAGALAGVAAAEAMFGAPVFAVSEKVRGGLPQAFAEAVATLGLLLVAFGASRRSLEAAAVAVGAYIAAAYWFTSSTSFATPAVTLARALTNTFTGIRPADVPGFLAGQLCGATAFVALRKALSSQT
jgi:glycerol uptake facilitator-like aquaporin